MTAFAERTNPHTLRMPTTTTGACQLLAEDPDLLEAIDPAERERATASCRVATMRIARGRWTVPAAVRLEGGIGLLILEGLLIRRTGIDGRFGAELLGEGDILRPWQGEDSEPTLTQTTGWRALAPSRVALLDARAAETMAAWPALTGRLVGRALDRSRNLAINMAIVQQARVTTRVHMLLWHLADRWGRVRADGVILPLALSHSVVGELVAARRPTVTGALSELTRAGVVQALAPGWRLSGEPPGELLALQTISPPGG